MKPWAPVLAVVAVSLFMPRTVVAQTPPIAAFSPCAWGSADCNACVADPVWSVQHLRSHGDAMGFHMNGTPDVDLLHHWQGVQRLMGAGGRYVAISRSLEHESTDVSFVVVEMASRDLDALRFRSNRLHPSWPIALTAPRVRDKVVRTMPHEAGFLHAGGVQSLATSWQCRSRRARGRRWCSTTSPIPSIRKAGQQVDHTPLADEAGTATLAKLANGHFLLVIGRSDAVWLDFYVSTGTDLRTTDYTWFDTWHEDELTGDDSKFGNYQNLSFVAGCGGTLFMAGHSPELRRRFRRRLRRSVHGDQRPGDDVAIHKVAKKKLTCGAIVISMLPAGYTSIPAGSCTYTERRTTMTECPTTGGATALSPSRHECAGPACSTEFAEFRPVPHDSCATIEDAWVELYSDSGFGGRSLMIDFVDRTLEDYSDLDHAEDFGDEASSVRWCLPHGAAVRLWGNAGPCDGSHRDLVGDGTFHDISDLGSVGFGDTASCVKWIGGPFARAGSDRRLECRGPTTQAQLDGRASISLEGGLMFLWEAAGVAFEDATAERPLGSFALGQTGVTLTVSDPAGSDSDSVTVNIVDTIAPTIACPANVVVDATAPGGAAVSYPPPTAVDGCSVPRVVCDPSAGSLFPVGTNSVQCTATDNSSHVASCSFTVKVRVRPSRRPISSSRSTDCPACRTASRTAWS